MELQGRNVAWDGWTRVRGVRCRRERDGIGVGCGCECVGVWVECAAPPEEWLFPEALARQCRQWSDPQDRHSVASSTSPELRSDIVGSRRVSDNTRSSAESRTADPTLPLTHLPLWHAPQLHPLLTRLSNHHHTHTHTHNTHRRTWAVLSCGCFHTAGWRRCCEVQPS
jgi:hypothetical protein